MLSITSASYIECQVGLINTTLLLHNLFFCCSENQFLSLPDDTCTLTPAFRQVEELSINKMQLSWNQVRERGREGEIHDLAKILSLKNFGIFLDRCV